MQERFCNVNEEPRLRKSRIDAIKIKPGIVQNNRSIVPYVPRPESEMYVVHRRLRLGGLYFMQIIRFVVSYANNFRSFGRTIRLCAVLLELCS